VTDPAGRWVIATYGSRAYQALLDIREFAGMAERLAARGRFNFSRDETI